MFVGVTFRAVGVLWLIVVLDLAFVRVLQSLGRIARVQCLLNAVFRGYY